jgi:hypothetical protein
MDDGVVVFGSTVEVAMLLGIGFPDICLLSNKRRVCILEAKKRECIIVGQYFLHLCLLYCVYIF